MTGEARPRDAAVVERAGGASVLQRRLVVACNFPPAPYAIGGISSLRRPGLVLAPARRC